MKAVEFCYWLQGLFELGKPEALTAEQTDLIKRHLDMVFVHEIDRSYPAAEQAVLDAAHEGRPLPSRRPPRPDLGGGRDVLIRC